MDSRLSSLPDWYRALSLTERVERLRAGETIGTGSIDCERSERRQRQWQAQPPFATGAGIEPRLAVDGITREEWARVLGEPPERLRDCGPAAPAWLETVVSAYAAPRPDRADSSLYVEREASDAGQLLPFAELAGPLVEAARERLTRAARELCSGMSSPPFDPDLIWETLAKDLPWQLAQMASRSMILELNVARLRDELRGETGEERFASFVERLRTPETALGLLQEYPVLARQFVTVLDHWVRFRLEFLAQLCADWDAVRRAFNPHADPGRLARLNDAGDNHRGGRSVLIATFASGFRVVYKPKPLTVDVHFQELLEWLNERGQQPPFRRLTILDRGSYGWVEFVEGRGCNSEAEVQRFYERQGGQLALLYVLEATDFHSENLIAAGEHPVLVDLEALFHPPMPDANADVTGGAAESVLDRSVLRTGLLPERIWTEADAEGIDISGLAAELEQQTPFGVPRWEGVGTDEMRVVFKQVTIPGGQNRPTIDGRVVDVSDHTADVAAGFAGVYRLLMQHRRELLADGSPVRRCAADEVRVILRPTTTYSVLLRESFHPDMLRDALDRDQLFDRLWVHVQDRPYLARVMRSEQEDLRCGDIPLFTARPDARDLWSSTGERIPDFFEQPGMTLVCRNLEQLGEADLARQLWIIRASLATLQKNVGRTKRPARDYPPSVEIADRARLLAAAVAVAERLDELALRDGAGVSWIGLTAIDERRCSLELLGSDLYDGLPGVVLFMACLGEITGEARWTELARGAHATLSSQLRRRGSSINSLGAFSGWGGIIYLLTHLGVLWEEPALLAEAEAAVDYVPQLIEQDDHFDVITGAAGCLASLVCLHACAPSAQVRAQAERCGRWLLDHAVPANGGIGWPAVLPARGPLTGFSHGAAGIAWALRELSVLTGEERYAEACRAAVAYERSVFAPDAGNWPDLREPDPSEDPEAAESFVTAWCHGAPGIGLARLQLLRHEDDPLARSEIEAAIRTTLRHGFGRNHSLCHGDLGNIELLLLAEQAGVEPGESGACRVHIDRLAAGILEDIRLHGWITGVPQGVESPGLMTGLAGIGYGLLRLAEPARVPSVLTLSPPRKEGDRDG